MFFFFAMIPKTYGDATPLGQRPLSLLPVVYHIWASAKMVQLEDSFQSWVLSAGVVVVGVWYCALVQLILTFISL